uniref:Ionotropic receptor n=1 Tax=Protaetia brevitarsis TaxID=348688 RepID=A0A411HR73_PROBE|nr:ionotropic receptor [Protaetia brevitarsis]
MRTLLVLLTAIVSVKSYLDDCSVGLLQDDDDQIKKIAFMAESEILGFENMIEPVTAFRSYDTLTVTCHMIDSGVIALFGPQSEDNAQIVESVCNNKDIPHMETRWNDQPGKLTNTLNLYPHGPTFSKALADLVEARQWDTFTVFYEDNESLARVSEILKRERELSISIKQLDAMGTGNYRPILKEAWRSGHTRFVIDCKVDNLIQLLQQAQQVGMMTSRYYYIITNPDLQTVDLEPYKYSDTNITGVRIIDPEAEATKRLVGMINQKQIDLELDPSHAQIIAPHELRVETALTIDGLNLLRMSLDHLPEHTRCGPEIACQDKKGWIHGSTALNYMKMTSFDGITGLVKLDSEGHRTDFNLDIIELSEDGLVKVATWNLTDGIKFLVGDDDYDLHDLSFVVITALTEPYGMLTDSQVSLVGNARYEGFAIDLIHELSLLEKFNYTFIIREDKSNGSKNKVTGKWDGMIGDLIDKKADLAITDLTITSEREEAVDFTTPFMNLGISILYQKPQKAPPNFFSFAEPFAFEVWLWLGGAYFIVSISLFIMGRLCPSEWTNPYPCVEEPEFLINQFSLRNSFWFTIGSLMQQGTEIAPIAYATRMTAGIWWFFTLIMVSSYTANLAAFLATENPDIPFNDVYELVEKASKSNIKYGAKNKGATMNFFRDSNNDDFKKIYNYMIANEKQVMVGDNKEGVLRAEREPYAFFMESVSIEYEIQRHCNLSKVGDLLDEKGYGIAMRKDSPYRHKLNTAVLKLQENGKISDLKRKWWEERKGGGQCSGEVESQEAKPLTLKNVGGVFWVTVGGVAVAVVLVFVEMFLHVMKESIKHKAAFWAELSEELKFYMKFKGLVKPVRLKKGDSKSPDDSDKSEKSEQHEMQGEANGRSYGFLPELIKQPLE